MSQVHTAGKVATKVAVDSEGVLRVTYHNTPVVTVYPNGRIVLNTNGYFTVTTKTRMNQASRQFNLGFHVYQENFDWFVDVDGHTLEFNNRELCIRNGDSHGERRHEFRGMRGVREIR